ncbi:MAG: hypothetical protein JOZ73_01940 [Solirubrobacterales bacterium]|nr:hypothetical protein [Solirubrobacterales bacterium]
MAAQKSTNKKRRSRKRARTTRPPAAKGPTRREQREQRQAAAERQAYSSQRPAGTVGERPPSPFGGVPVSEIAIFVGAVGLVVGLIASIAAALIVGTVVCTAGVLEITVREHFSGFRSHSTLLAAIPAVGLEVALVLAFGHPRNRGLLLLAVVPVFGLCFWLLRRRFEVARQARLARPPAPRS